MPDIGAHRQFNAVEREIHLPDVRRDAGRRRPAGDGEPEIAESLADQWRHGLRRPRRADGIVARNSQLSCQTTGSPKILLNQLLLLIVLLAPSIHDECSHCIQSD
jgi:hypothetical protein